MADIVMTDKSQIDSATLDILLTETPVAGVQLLRLNRPAQHNALNTPLLKALAEALELANADAAIHAVVVTGGPRVFAAGADVAEMAAMDMVAMMASERPLLWQRIARFSKPLIAAVNGFALGAGNELVMHADIVIAGDNARFGQPEVGLGIIPGAGGTQRLLRMVGKSLAMKLVLSGEFLSAEQALTAGLAAEVCVAELCEERAIKLAATIASKPTLAVKLAKQALLNAYETNLQAGLVLEQQAFVSLAATEDRNEGINAFLEKRRPQFNGK
jgi:enoyl-CoA hydratase